MDEYGRCQVCGDVVEAYSRDVWGVDRLDTRRVMPVRPLRAEPCGHDQPRPVVWRGESATHPTSSA